ncbi:MAG: two-component system chemotaxis family sensor kinase CheA, partial [bacterium]
MSNGNNKDDFSYDNQTSMLGGGDLQGELLAAFKSELDEYLQMLNMGLLKIEQGESSDQLIQEIFRTAHSMKGTSGAFGLTKIQKISHALENLFGAVRSKRFIMDKLAFDVCYEGLDMISKLMEMELAGTETPAQIEVNFAQSVEILLNSGTIGTTDPNLQQKTVTDRYAPSAEDLSFASDNGNAPFIVGGGLSDSELEMDTAAGSKLKNNQPNISPVSQSQLVQSNPYPQTYEPVASSPGSFTSGGGTAILGDSDLQGELLAAFKSELDEYLQVLNIGLLKIEQGESSDTLIQEIFRTAHSMKGTSGAFGLTKIQKISHALENLFGVVRSKRFVMDKISFDVCYEGLDLINKLMDMELAGAETPAMVEVDFGKRIEEILSGNSQPTTPVVVQSTVPNRPLMPPVNQPAPSTVPNRPSMPPVNQPAPSAVPNRPSMPPNLAPPINSSPSNGVPGRPPMPPTTSQPAMGVGVGLAHGPMLTKDLHRELLDSFRSELDDYLEALNNKLLKLEQNT